MKTDYIILAAVALLVFGFFFFKRRIAPTYQVTAGEIPQVIEQLQRTMKSDNFAVLMFSSQQPTDGDAVNLQYSIENGLVGIDWVLISKTNIADSEKVQSLAKEFGLSFTKHEMNGVHYLRATGSNIDKLGISIITKLYGIPSNTKLDLITEGFEWLPPAA